MQKYITFGIQPIPDQAAQKTVNKLQSELAAIGAKRDRAEAQYRSLTNAMQGAKVSAEHSSAYRTPDVAEHQAEELRLKVERLKIELDQLQLESGIVRRVNDEYLPLLEKSEREQRLILQQMPEVARQHVIAVFQRDFPADKFPVYPEVFERYVNNHPVVHYQTMAAQSSANNQNALPSQVRHALEQIDGRIKNLKINIAANAKLVDEATAEASQIKAEKAQADLQQKELCDRLDSEQKSAFQKALALVGLKSQ